MKQQVKCLIFLLASIGLLGSSFVANAQTYYWVGGQGDWTDLSHWAATSGGAGGAYIQVPQSYNDVVIDGGSGFANISQNNRYITFNTQGANATCKDLIIAPQTTGFYLRANMRFDIYGKVDIQQINLTTNGWNGQISLFSADSVVHNFGGLKLNNNSLKVEPTNGTHVFKGLQTNYTLLDLNPGANGKVYFQDIFQAYNVTARSGKLYFQTPVLGINGSDLFKFTAIGGESYFEQNSKINYLYLQGSAKVFAQHNNHNWYGVYINDNGNAILDITNSTIYNQATWSWIYSIPKLIADNSTIYATNENTFIAGNQQYNKVVFQNNANLKSNSVNPLSNLGTFKELVFEKGFWAFADNHFTITEKLEIKNNGLYNQEGNFANPTPHIINFTLAQGAKTYLQGDCINPLTLRMTNFNFGDNTSTNIYADYVILDQVNAYGNNQPYEIGANSKHVPNSENLGWATLGNTGKTYIWVGPIPSNINTVSSYAKWHDGRNWADASIYPNAQSGDTQLAANCVPSIYDNVIFKNNAYVSVNEAYVGINNMTWQGTGNLANETYFNLNAIFEIFGNLEWSSSMKLAYNGVIKFRAVNEGQTIKSNGQTFPYKVIFESTRDHAGYVLLDNYQGNTSLENEYLLDFRRGILQANGNNIRVPNFVSETINYRQLNISNSNLFVTGGYFGRYPLDWNSQGKQFNIIDDNGTIHISKLGDGSGTNMKIYIGRGHDINSIIFYGDRPELFHPIEDGISIYRSLEFKQSGSIVSNKNQIDSIGILRTHTNNENALYPFNLTENNNTATMVIDSAIFLGNVNFSRDINYTSLLQLNSGHTYTIAAGNTKIQQLVDNALLKANGSCMQSIYIKNGSFSSNKPQNGSYLTIENNTVQSANFTYSNSTTIGNTTGWSGSLAQGRTLYWYNKNIGRNAANWQDNSAWSLAENYMLDANGGNDVSIGNCPPTSLDIVYFTDNSFDEGDTVLVASAPQNISVKDMYWTNTKQAYLVSNSTNELLNIYGNLTWSNAMINQFNASIYFVGENHNSTIQSNGIKFASNIYFDGLGSTWTLQDDLVAETPHTSYGLILQAGTLNTNSKNMRLHSLYSNYNTARKLIIENSNIEILSYVASCWDLRGTRIELLSNNSEIKFLSGLTGSTTFHIQLGNNLSYEKISLVNGQPKISGVAIIIDELIFNKGGWLNTEASTIHKSISTNTDNNYLFEIHADANIFDSLVIKGNAVFKSSNQYNKLLELSPSKTYTFYAGKVQHIMNQGDFIATGTGGGGEIYFNTNITNEQSYIRKDSGQICVDFIYMRDIWAIGNGLSTETTCSDIYCDTAAISSLMPTFATSGRAVFNAGGNANNQGNNAGWDFNPYPAAPKMRLNSEQPNYFCTEEQYTAVFELIGKLPMNVYFDIEMNGRTQNISVLDIQPVRGSGTETDPYIWYYHFMPDQENTTKVIAQRVENMQCFYNEGIGTGRVEINTYACILPIDLISFDIACNEEKAIAKWEIAAGNNNAYFELQVSENGANFETLEIISAQENQTIYTANILKNKGSYYRLKMVDENNNISYSNILSVSCDFKNEAAQSTILFPNPINDIINIKYTSDKNESINFDIINVQGQVMYSNIFQAQTGENVYTFNSINLVNGVYFLRLKSNEKTPESIKFIVKK